MTESGDRRTTTIRRSLLANLVVLVAVVGGVILIVSWVSGQRTVEDLSALLIDPTARRTAAELDRFFSEVRSQVLIGRRWAERLPLDPTDYEALNGLFVPILQQHPQLSSMMVADSDGVEYLLLRDPLDPDVWTNRVVRADEWGTRVFNRRWNTATGEAEEGFSELDYDPRRRIWYEEALLTTEDAPVFWTAPVIFFVTKDPGITASTHFVTDEGKTVVVAFDLLLLDISRFTSSLEVSENGRGFVLVERQGAEGLRVVGLPRDERYGGDGALREALIFVPPDAAVADSAARLPAVPEIDVPAIEDAIAAWSDDDRPDAPFRFDSDGRAWLGGFHAFHLGRNTFWIGVTLPEDDLLGGLRLQRAALGLLMLVVLVVGLGRAAVLSRRFSAPVEALVAETERMSKGDLEPAAPVRSKIREFLRLAEAQQGMREGLKARMKLDKVERDLDIAREIQRGLLPTDRPDAPGFEIEGWSRPADQTGGDYFDWLTLPNGHTLITLADVTGHGIGPALIVAVCRAYMRAAAMSEHGPIEEAMARVNDLLYADIPEGRFVTAAVGVLAPERHEITLLSAGQAPLLFHKPGKDRTENWDADDLPLGVAPGLAFDAPRRVHFDPGDVLLLTTDGFFEWANGNGELYGIRRLEAFLAHHADRSPKDFIEALHAEVVAHAGGQPQPDDLTAVVIKRTAPT